jgi:uncharacterized protein involved in response to NO
LLPVLSKRFGLVRWAGERTLPDRLVLVLHVGYAFVPIGFLMAGLASYGTDFALATAAIHAWTTGAVGIMTLAVMTRATLGHTGRSLAASPLTEMIYAMVIIAAVARILAAFAYPDLLLHVAAFAWIGAFVGFALSYGPLLVGGGVR